MKIAIFINTSWNIYNFRLGLIRYFIRRGDDVMAIAPTDEYSAKLNKEGCTHYPVSIKGSGMGPLEDLLLLVRTWKILRKSRPDVVLSYTIKPNIYGSMVCRLLDIKVICNVSGLGTVFLWKGYVKTLAVSLYRFAFRFSSWVFFQNEEDRKDFLGVVKINPAKTGLLPGSGVDTDYFKPSKNGPHQKRETMFLMISRLIVEKGVSDYVEAIKLLKPGNPDCKFMLVGGLDESHSRSISRLTLDEWIAEGWIEYHDHAADIRPFIEQADVVVLPSYREGTPKTLLEAGAMGKALIATDVPGCRQVVLDGENGFLCKLKNPTDLASKMKLYMALSAEERTIMGENARESIINRYDQRIVIEHYARKIDDLVKQI